MAGELNWRKRTMTVFLDRKLHTWHSDRIDVGREESGWSRRKKRKSSGRYDVCKMEQVERNAKGEMWRQRDRGRTGR